jgi:spore maturation protein CgeB
MRKAMAALRASRALRADLAAHGLQTVRARHTCGHRVDELLEICGKALRNRRRKPLGASVFTTP